MRKPKLIVSRCLNFEKCRYDGQGYNDKVVESLKEHVEFITVCPEVEMGMTTPRNPIRIEKHKEKDEYKLIQHHSNYDYTDKMNEFANEFINNIEDVDGFILKSKSPSCGIKDVKIYHQGNKCNIGGSGNGFFSKKVIDKYKNLPIENEGRLKNYSIRDNFFTKIFAINNLKGCINIKDFYSSNEMLLKSYDEEKTIELGNMLYKDNIDNNNINLYKDSIYDILSSTRHKNHKLLIINSIFNKYKYNLTYDEIKMFNSIVESYEKGRIPFSSLALTIRIYATRFKDDKILNQTFFNPYPEGLINICDSGKGRDL